MTAEDLHRRLVEILCEDDQLKPERCLPLIEEFAREAAARTSPRLCEANGCYYGTSDDPPDAKPCGSSCLRHGLRQAGTP